MTLDEAISRAIDLNSQVVDGDLGPVYADMEAEMEKVFERLRHLHPVAGWTQRRVGEIAPRREGRAILLLAFPCPCAREPLRPGGKFSKMIAASVQGSVGLQSWPRWLPPWRCR